MDESLIRDTIPVVVLRGDVIFPVASPQQIDIVRDQSVRSVMSAVEGGKDVVFVLQKKDDADEPGFDDIYHIGTVATIKRIIKNAASGVIRINVESHYRCRIDAVITRDGVTLGCITECAEIADATTDTDNALARSLSETVIRYTRLRSAKQPAILGSFPFSVKNLGLVSDIVAHNLALPYQKKQTVLSELSHKKRCEALIAILLGEIEIIELQRSIESKVRSNMEQTQKEYYLREQLKVISDELADGDSPAQEAEEYRKKIAALNASDEVKQQLLDVCSKLGKLPLGSHEASVERNYLDLCVALPWGVCDEEHANVKEAQKTLDRDHYGLEQVKERILEFIAVMEISPRIKSQIICLAGPPGVGKTSIARSVAEALGRKYCRISLGGVHDEADIRGHRRTYIGAMPGRIISAIKKCGSSNPLMLLDEVDKLSSDYRGDPTSALLELLDPEQNNTFFDHFVDMPYDLSKVLFITTANDVSRIPQPLLDRMELITIPSYTAEEKLQIAKRHLTKKQLILHGLTGKQLRFTDKGLSALIEKYTSEAGVRSLERAIASLCRKAAKAIVSGECESVTVTEKALEKLLGPAKYKNEQPQRFTEPGIVNGLAYTSVGGTMLEIEATVMDGTGKLELTGSLGDVMKESVMIAKSYIRANAALFGIDPDFHKNKDIHIHFPEGATPKDGPSAGIAIATAILSALTGIPAKSDVAMTGEITLRGRVLAIGGLREKSMAAYNGSMTTVIIPEANAPEISKLSEAVKSRLNFVPVSRFSDVYPIALTSLPVSAPDNKSEITFMPPIGGNMHEATERVL